jgi:hypothetical protein
VTTETFPATTDVTITLDLAALLRAGGFLGENEDGDAVYSPSLVSEIVTAAAGQIATKVLNEELKEQVGEQVREQVAGAVQAALDLPVQATDTWGTPKGEAKPLRELLAQQAADQVQAWVNGRDGYSRESKFNTFLRNEVDAAVRRDLNGVLADAAARTKKAMEVAAAKAIADAAAGAVRAMSR